MALTTVPASMRAFGPTTLVVRATNAVLETLGAPAAPAWLTVGDAAAALGAPVDLADTLAADSLSAELLRVGAAIDGADRALARQVRAEDALALQAEDAVLKLLMLGWTRGATGGGLLDLQYGQVALLVWAAVDVALPLGGGDLAWMLREHRTAQSIRLVALCGEAGMDGLQRNVDALLPAAVQAAERASARTDALAEALAPFVPGLVAHGEGAARRIALQGDKLPLYKWLATMIAAEHAAVRARSG